MAPSIHGVKTATIASDRKVALFVDRSRVDPIRRALPGRIQSLDVLAVHATETTDGDPEDPSSATRPASKRDVFGPTPRRSPPGTAPRRLRGRPPQWCFETEDTRPAACCNIRYKIVSVPTMVFHWSFGRRTPAARCWSCRSGRQCVASSDRSTARCRRSDAEDTNQRQSEVSSV